MSKIRKCFKFVFNADYRFLVLAAQGRQRGLSDEEFISKMYSIILGKELNLSNPKTFNEKMQYLKLYGFKEEYTDMVDKFKARDYVARIVGEKYTIPLLGNWKSADDIDFDLLPNQFVLKCNHNSGRGMCICKDKSTLDLKKVRKKLSRGLKQDYFYIGREKPYRGVEKRIIAEKFMKDGDCDFLPVYKFLCFSGEPRIIQTIQNDKQPNESIDYFDTDWNLLNLRQNYPNSKKPYARPEQLEEMLDVVRRLCKGFPFIRVDLYTINGGVAFSEFTFYSDCGFAAFDPPEWDDILGSYITLAGESNES